MASSARTPTHTNSRPPDESPPLSALSPVSPTFRDLQNFDAPVLNLNMPSPGTAQLFAPPTSSDFGSDDFNGAMRNRQRRSLYSPYGSTKRVGTSPAQAPRRSPRNSRQSPRMLQLGSPPSDRIKFDPPSDHHHFLQPAPRTKREPSGNDMGLDPFTPHGEGHVAGHNTHPTFKNDPPHISEADRGTVPRMRQMFDEDPTRTLRSTPMRVVTTSSGYKIAIPPDALRAIKAMKDTEEEITFYPLLIPDEHGSVLPVPQYGMGDDQSKLRRLADAARQEQQAAAPVADNSANKQSSRPKYYKCSRCGQPKKGHVCALSGDGSIGEVGQMSGEGKNGGNGSGSERHSPDHPGAGGRDGGQVELGRSEGQRHGGVPQQSGGGGMSSFLPASSGMPSGGEGLASISEAFAPEHRHPMLGDTAGKPQHSLQPSLDMP